MASSVDSNSLFRVDGIVAVITGGLGIGLIMARALALNGANEVYILGRRLEVLNTAVQEHSSLVPLQCDVTSKENLQAAVSRITDEVGYVNLVVANSGSIGPPARFNPSSSLAELRETLFTNFSMDAMNEVLNLNVTAAFFSMTAFLEPLNAGNKNALKGGFAKPINEGSHVLLFRVSKVVIIQVTKHASTQLARFGIRMNAIALGVYPSTLSSILMGNRKPEEESIDDQLFIPARRFGGDEEMTGAILYLTSRSGSFSNGSILITDSGRLSVMTGTY
ncbi:hypothetical protein QQZ08_001112 [Neonectria magnoliae]|uniref:Uncharacterized protein n=1 Tax=Neonectria magnoliae TaxID=2732573 RepID=A0ABR1IH98_9HYPO